MSQNLYTFDAQSKEQVRKFRFGSSKAQTLQALVLQVTHPDQVIKIEETDPESPLSSTEDLQEALPENSPRFVLLSYPIEFSDGRKSTPLILLYYRPLNTSQKNRMTYAGAVELVRNETGVNKVVEVEELEELDDIKGLITG